MFGSLVIVCATKSETHEHEKTKFSNCDDWIVFPIVAIKNIILINNKRMRTKTKSKKNIIFSDDLV